MQENSFKGLKKKDQFLRS